MRRLALGIALLALAAACTPMQWVKGDAGGAEMRAELQECRREAWQEARSRFLFYHPIAPAVFSDSLGRRFLVWPYGPFADPFGDQFMEESRLTDFCMRARGWRLEPVPEAQAQADTIQPSPAGASSGKP